MLRSLMSGVAGLKSYQTKMDVIGNNIANVSTVGFKSSTVNFSDVFYQKTASATSASTLSQRAGTNAKQIGYGSAVASIATTVATQGGSQTTNRALDLMINGNAFFIVQMNGENYFTKNGAFDIDGLGNLCTESGGLVMGWGVDDETGQIIQDAVSPIRVYSPENQTTEPDATTDIYFQGNIDSNDTSLEEGKIIQMDFYDNLGNQYAAKYKVEAGLSEDKNEYSVVLTDVVDAQGKSIFLDYVVSNGATTYLEKDNVTIEFGGYTYMLDSVDSVTGEVTLKSYAKGATGVLEETLGDKTIPAYISYDPNNTDTTDGVGGVLYRLNDNGFEAIPESEIHLYASVDAYGNLTVNKSIDESSDCAYYKVGDQMIPIAEGAMSDIKTTITLTDFNTVSDSIPSYFDSASNTFKTIPKNIYDNLIDADGDLVLPVNFDITTTNADGTTTTNTYNTAYYKDASGNYLKIQTDTATPNTWKGGFDDVTAMIKGNAEEITQAPVNKGAELLFNASTGQFASVSGASSRYDENGNLITTNVTFKVYTSDSRLETSAKDLFEEITMDFSTLTMFADGGNSTVSGVRGNLETGLGAGWASGVLTGVSVSNDGRIYGEYDNGVTELLGQIAVTSFSNPTGLEAVGDSLFQETVNSGEFDGIGSDITVLGLSITSGALESSNVDLSNEFTNMITTQRGFEANSKIITTSDEMLDTLINLKR